MLVGAVVWLTFGPAAAAGAAAFALAFCWIGLLPLAGVVTEEMLGIEDGDGKRTADPLETLRERYARGEIGEAEFERGLERLLETEDGVPERAGGRRERERPREREPATDR